ncbi:glycosyltransferase [Sphingobacterium siyangense]|uniref:glycosyltransferase n=1 Tax=Sphingobacterium TaxID=28453 RepID=UPI003DA26A2B
MNQENMQITVAICTYNGAQYLEEQLYSIMTQQRAPDQVVISDDNSDDTTWSIIMEFQRKYPTIIEAHRQQKNIGLNSNFAFVLSKATGDYIAICDQDDIWYSNKLEIIEQYITHNPTYNIFHHDENILGKKKNDTTIKERRFWLPYQESGVSIGFVFNRLTGHKVVLCRTLLQYILPIPEEVFYDWWIFVVAAIKGKTKYIDIPLMDYRMHSNSAYFSDVSKQLTHVTGPIKIALNAFSKVDGINELDKNNLTQLIALYENHTAQKFDFKLFLFFLRKRNYLFKDFHTDEKGLVRQLFLVRLCRAFSKW